MADYYQRLYTFIQHSGMIPDSDEKNDEDIIGVLSSYPLDQFLGTSSSNHAIIRFVIT